MKRSLPNVLSLIPALLLFASCGGGGETSTPLSAPNSVGFTVEDAPVDNLSTADITLSSLKLIATGGASTGNLLASPRSFEFLGLTSKQALLTLSPSVPAGTYDRVELTASAASARDLSGVPVAVTLRTNLQISSLTDFGGAAMTFDGSGFVPVRLDIDLNQSFSDDPISPGDLFFDLSFTAATDLAPAFDEFRARVVDVNLGNSSFLARIIDDASPGQDFGLLDVLVSDGDFLVHDDGRTFATARGFLDEVDPGDVVQVSGAMTASGSFDASRVITEDDEDGLSGSNRIEIEGEVLSLDTGAGTFELSIREIEKGATTVAPVLASLGNPSSITIAFDQTTRLFADDSASSGDDLVATTLIPGMEVDVRFATFAAPEPFPATSIEIGDGRSEGEGVEYEGIVASTAGLPLSFTMQFDNSEPAVLSGLVAAPVTVTLAGGPRIFLDSGPDPSLLPSEIVSGLRCEVHGDLSGPPSSPQLMATRVKLKPGELEGTLVSVDLGASAVTVQVTEIDRNFGGGSNPAGTEVIDVDPSAFLRGDDGAISLVDLAAMLNGLGAGQSIEVEIEGIGDGSGGFLTWDIRAETEDDS
ncbi:MAG: DUF4382 domain-containing protein [Planctomycetota bacterium]|jgi:hypothetical protein